MASTSLPLSTKPRSSAATVGEDAQHIGGQGQVAIEINPTPPSIQSSSNHNDDQGDFEESEDPVYDADVARADDTPPAVPHVIKHHTETKRCLWRYFLVLCLLAAIALIVFFIAKYAGGSDSTCVPIDCQVSSWERWTPCTKRCDGRRNHTRDIILHSDCKGEPCLHLYEEEDCNIGCCLDCEVTFWSPWSACSAECGAEKSHTRAIVLDNDDCGRACPSLEEIQYCDIDGCCMDCEISEWSSYSPCSASCGSGTRSRTQTILKAPNSCGKTCPESFEEVHECNTQPCGE